MSMKLFTWLTLAGIAALLGGGCSDSPEDGSSGADSKGDTTDIGLGEGGGNPTFGPGDGGSTGGGEDIDTTGPGDTSTGEGGETPVGCTSNADCVGTGSPICGPGGVCVECAEDTDCGTNASCLLGECQGNICTPGTTACDGNKLSICNSTGTGYSESLDCAPGTCEDGACTGCNPGDTWCFAGNAYTCPPDGPGMLSEVCGPQNPCIEGACAVCYPNTGKCEGQKAFKCAGDGSEWQFTKECVAGEDCISGVCQSACSSDIKFNTNVGCDYWAVDLDNVEGDETSVGADNAQFAVVVSNTSDTTATVTITKSSGGEPQAQADVAPKALHIFNLPPRNVNGSVKGERAWRVQATAPIVAYQFNPLENEKVYSNDASVLFPSNAWGKEYLVMSRQQFGAEADGAVHGFVTVVAGFKDTEVTVTVTTPTSAGPGDVPALAAGESFTVTLQPFEVLSLQSATDGGDLTGTSVVASKPVGVFGGHECAFSAAECCCDHLEQQMLPLSAWGKTYVAARSAKRGFEPDYWRILASADDTQVITTPNQGYIPPMKKGQFIEIASTQDFQIDATNPILVGQIMASSFEINGTCATGCKNGAICTPNGSWTMCFVQTECQVDINCPPSHACIVQSGPFGPVGSCEPIGDPAFMLAVPVEQFRDEYIFLAPPKYLNDYLTIIMPAGASVLLDGSETVTGNTIPTTTWTSKTIPITDGVHRIESTNGTKFGIMVHGHDDDVSYGYPGGMALEDLTIP
jgi:hypothetical protein